MSNIKGIFFALVCMLSVMACEPVQNELTYDTDILDIYTVKNGNVLVPEFYGDSSVYVDNIKDFDLQAGDRVTLILHYHFDAYNTKENYLKIMELVEKIPTLSMSPRDGAEDVAYGLPLGVMDYLYYKPHMWVWNNRLNVNVLFDANPETTEFKLTLRGIANDTVTMNLLAKADEPLEKKSAKLLSYDLADLPGMFSDDEKVALKSYEKLKFRVYMKEKDKDGKLLDRPYTVVTGEYANPLYY